MIDRNLSFIILGSTLMFLNGCTHMEQPVQNKKISTYLKNKTLSNNHKNVEHEDLMEKAIGKNPINYKNKESIKPIKIDEFGSIDKIIKVLQKKVDKKIIVNKDDYIKYNTDSIVIKASFGDVDTFLNYVNFSNSGILIKKVETDRFIFLNLQTNLQTYKKLKKTIYTSNGHMSPLFEITNIARDNSLLLTIEDNAKSILTPLAFNSFNGNAFDYISKICQQKDLFFDLTDKEIKISRLKEKIYPITISSLVTNSMSTSATEVPEDKGVGSTQTSSSVSIKNELYKDLLDGVKSILAMGTQKSSSALSGSSSQLIVLTTPSKMKEIDTFIENFNDVYSKKIVINIRLVEVLLNENHSNGIDLDTLKGALTLSTVLGATSSATSGNALSFNSAEFSSVFKALNEFGETKIVSSPKTTTLNTIETSMFLGKTVEYLSNITIQNTFASSTVAMPSYSTETKTVNNGISLIIKPKIVDDKVQILIQAKISSLQGFDENSIGGAITTKSAIVNKKDFLHVIELNKNETWFLAGMKEHYSKKIKSGMPYIDKRDNWFDFIGGNRKSEGYDVESALFISAQVIE